ncbi:lysophospholipid acyltransferase family protein [Cerasicoccus maritimus]|uniref:lysophospholipid acyltransferase family protein n=1 Tax=Cerasicoccus maritimus TaxID=490089 RepID=UPI002852843D|nr:lysophospholipid acyltransferase family protein [Cerasicoccus maritimus]
MKPFYRNMRASLAAWFYTFNGLQVYGASNVPVEGPFLLACNHASFLDPPVFAVACPRELHFFARNTLWKGVFGTLITNLNAIPIDRDGERDLQAFRRVFAALKDGGTLLVFPEGTRTPDGELHEGKKGIGMIACRAQVPVVPARIFGSYDMWNRHQKLPRLTTPLGVSFGKPIPVSEYDPGKTDSQRYDTAAARIMEGIAKLEDARVKNALPFDRAI